MERRPKKRKGWLETEHVRPFNVSILHLHGECVKHRHILLFSAVAIYAGAVFALAPGLGVSSNYFVIIPLLAAALGFGSPGGIVAGALGLPANLLMYNILGHPEFSPASKVIAELSGIVLGLSLGLLSDYFAEVSLEIRRRQGVEESLREALATKELLLRELQHRVKNNLNVMKSMVMLQKSRSSNPDFTEAADELIGRIFAMALVHDRFYGDAGMDSVDLGEYLVSLTMNIALSLGLDESKITRRIDSRGFRLPADAAMPLGLIVNEVFMNTAKYAKTNTHPQPSISISLDIEGGECRLTIEDDGPGPSADATPGLGMKLIASLASNLGGSATLSSAGDNGAPAGTRFVLIWRDNPARR